MSQRSRVRYPVLQHTFIFSSADSGRAVVSYWRKYVHKVLVNHLGGLSLPRNSVLRLIDGPDMTIDVYCGCKAKIQQQQQLLHCHAVIDSIYAIKSTFWLWTLQCNYATADSVMCSVHSAPLTS